ncbi:hypothetical protein Q1695_003189 [Nippostrongylus brasiliensis]|nr:hypothetical protein Q1695_003189 [Nippostrongylus brasiliensis]
MGQRCSRAAGLGATITNSTMQRAFLGNGRSSDEVLRSESSAQSLTGQTTRDETANVVEQPQQMQVHPDEDDGTTSHGRSTKTFKMNPIRQASSFQFRTTMVC